MIPSVLLVALGAGVAVGRARRSAGAAAGVALAVGFLWGAIVLATTPGALARFVSFDENGGLAAVDLFAGAAVLGILNALPAVFLGWWIGREVRRRRDRRAGRSPDPPGVR